VSGRRTWQKADLYKWANDQQQLDMRSKALLKEMVGLAQADGSVWFLVPDMAYACNCVDRTIQLILRKLQAALLIELTDETHRLKNSTRSVPVYRLLPEGFFGASMGEILSPIEPARVKSEASMGETGFHPQGQQGHQERADALSAGARERDALFDAIVMAADPALLLFADLEAARASLDGLAEQGLPVDRLPQVLRFMAADPEFRSRKHPPQLHTWLARGMWRGWLAKLDAAAGPAEPEAGPAAICSADDGATAAWIGAMAEMQTKMGATSFGSWLARAALGQVGETFYVVAWTSVAREWLAQHRWADLQAAWARRDGRPLELVDRRQFEALKRRQGEA